LKESNISCKEILMAIEKLHNWRVKYNNEKIGFGYDQYEPNREFYYPEAGALWGNGYVKLYQITKKEEYLNLAENAAKQLIEIRNKKYREFSWGLPWKWHDCPNTFSFLITTVYGGEFFLNLYKVTKNKKYLGIAQSVGNWIINECGYKKEDEGIWFYYSDCEVFHYPIFNAISKASGYLAKLYMHTKKRHFQTMAELAAVYVINKQNRDGSWYYSNKSMYIDNIHTGYVIEGLCDVYEIFPHMRKKLQKVLKAAGDFYWRNLYTPEGFGFEYTVTEPSFKKILYNLKKIFLRSSLETRLWGYATGIRAFTKLSKALSIENKGSIIIKYVIKNLQDKSGAFKYKSKDKRFYIRHEAHMFDALATFVYENYLRNNKNLKF